MLQNRNVLMDLMFFGDKTEVLIIPSLIFSIWRVANKFHIYFCNCAGEAGIELDAGAVPILLVFCALL